MSVGAALAVAHDVQRSVDVLGSGAKDPVIRAYLRRAEDTIILITGDRNFAARCRQEGSRLACLWLHDLADQELHRVTELLDVIEREAVLLGRRFYMEIRARSYHVQR